MKVYDVHIYDPFTDDWDNEGLVGPLDPISCEESEEAGTLSELEMVHPYDEAGKWEAIAAGRLLKVWVQMRIPPAMDGSTYVTSVERWTVKATATKAQRTIYTKQTGGKKKKAVPEGTQVTVIKRPESGRVQMESAKYGSGWMDPAGLDFVEQVLIPGNASGIYQTEPALEIRQQMFVIDRVDPGEREIKAHAVHLPYLFMHNLTSFGDGSLMSISDALEGIYEGCLDDHDFTWHTDMADERSGAMWQNVNPIKALLDSETGVLARWGCDLIWDNYDGYFLSKAGRDTGTVIEYGKNLQGWSMSEDDSSVATHILPIGHLKNGNELRLPEVFVVSDRASDYPEKRICLLACEGCDVGKNGVTESLAYLRMREQAQALLDSGCDVPVVSLSVDVMQTDDADGVAAVLEPLGMYDTALVRIPRIGKQVRMQVVRRTFDCIRGRVLKTELGSVGATLSTSQLASWQIPGGVSAGKLVPGSVGAAQLGSDVIGARHIQAGSVNTDALQAESVTAGKIAAGAVDAGKVTADFISANTAEAQNLRAQVANVADAQIGNANIDYAQIKYLSSELSEMENMIVRDGLADRFFMEKLQVKNLQVIEQTVGNLVVKASDGNYYRLDVDTVAGTVAPVMVTVTDGEIVAGVTDDGSRSIIETDLTVDDLGATSIKAMNALIDEISGARLLFNEAFIGKLYTNMIFSDGSESIQIISQRAQQALNDIQAVVKITPDGVVVSDMNRGADTTKALVAPDGFSVVDKNGQTAASLGLRRQTLGTLIIWETEDGGHAFV